jgi:hypothetical protein
MADCDHNAGAIPDGPRRIRSPSFVAFSGNFILIFFGLCSNAMSGTSCLSESAMVDYRCIQGLSTLEFRRSVREIVLRKGWTMRKVLLTALAVLAFVAFTFSGCKKQTPPPTKAPEKEKAAPAPAPSTTEQPAAPAPNTSTTVQPAAPAPNTPPPAKAP